MALPMQERVIPDIGARLWISWIQSVLMGGAVDRSRSFAQALGTTWIGRGKKILSKTLMHFNFGQIIEALASGYPRDPQDNRILR